MNKHDMPSLHSHLCDKVKGLRPYHKHDITLPHKNAGQIVQKVKDAGRDWEVKLIGNKHISLISLYLTNALGAII